MKREKIVSYSMLILLILCLLPVMYVGRYNHPVGDDFYYGLEPHLVWEETGSLFQTIWAACLGVAEQYQIWQGTYSAMFFMYLAPNVFGEWAYGFVTTTMVLLLTGGIFYLLKPLLVDLAGSSRHLWCLLSCALSLLCIQTVPSQGETFFWYNGSMYYTGFFAITLLFWGLLVRYLQNPLPRRAVVMAFLAIFLAGGNYVSLLPSMILLACLTAWFLWKKRDRRLVGLTLALLCMLAGFAVSAAAPGNRLRQSDMWQIPAWKAVAKSLLQGIRYFLAWTRQGWWLTAALVLPFLWKSYSRLSFRFPCPILVVSFSYGVFCSMSCPLFYTMNSTGPARAVAIVYYAYILTSFFCLYYAAGYLHRIMREKKVQGHSPRIQKIAPAGWIAGTILLCVLFLAGKGADCTTVKALDILLSGQGQTYHWEYQARLDVLHDPSVADVILAPYSDPPEMLYVGDFETDPEHFNNQKVAAFYHKNTVRVQP